jgi:hypothetical protein
VDARSLSLSIGPEPANSCPATHCPLATVTWQAANTASFSCSSSFASTPYIDTPFAKDIAHPRAACELLDPKHCGESPPYQS